MPLYFPTGLFGFLEKEVDIERQTLEGGTAISGETDRVAVDGGGRVFANFGKGTALDRNVVLAWRSATGILEEGVTAVIVPFCDGRHQPGPPLPVAVPHSDESPFYDETLYYGSGGLTGTATGAAALRAVQISFAGDLLACPLTGGHWFAIEHAGKGWRAYKILRVVSQTDTTATVEFRPPLREAVAIGETLDFVNPRCLMVVDGRPGSAVSYGRAIDTAIRFVEAP